MKQLVASWIEAERQHHGNTLGKAIENLNAVLNMRANCSRVSEWRRGVYCPSPVVLSLMLSQTLPWALKKAGIAASNPQFRELEKLLWVSVEKDGQHYIELL